jgi:phospholipid transport system substrate-binding protein
MHDYVTRVFPTLMLPPWDITMPTMTLRRRTLARLALLCLIASPIPVQAADSAVTAPVQRLYDGLLGVMKAGTAVPFGQRYNQLASTVDAVFDLSTILQTSVGLSWDALPAGQQSALRTAFRRYTIASYVNNFDAFGGQRFEVSPDTRELPNHEEVVSTRIIPASGSAHRLDYVMRQDNGVWRIVDVLADGTISRVAVQRSDFRRELLQGGSEGLVVSLQTKADELAGG